MAKSRENKIQIRNSVNDFLVFSKENDGDGVDVLVADENVWLTQKSMCSLYEASKSTVSEHLTNIFASKELNEASTVRDFRTVAPNSKTYKYKYYNLQAIIAVGLTDAGKVTAFEAKIHAEGEFEKYRVVQDRMFVSGFDRFLQEADIEGLRLEKDG